MFSTFWSIFQTLVFLFILAFVIGFLTNGVSVDSTSTQTDSGKTGDSSTSNPRT